MNIAFDMTETTITGSWWCHKREPFSTSLALCERIGFHSQRPVTWSFDVFFDLSKLLSKQLRHQSFETPSPSSLCHCNIQTGRFFWYHVLKLLYALHFVMICYNYDHIIHNKIHCCRLDIIPCNVFVIQDKFSFPMHQAFYCSHSHKIY